MLAVLSKDPGAKRLPMQLQATKCTLTLTVHWELALLAVASEQFLRPEHVARQVTAHRAPDHHQTGTTLGHLQGRKDQRGHHHVALSKDCLPAAR